MHIYIYMFMYIYIYTHTYTENICVSVHLFSDLAVREELLAAYRPIRSLALRSRTLARSHAHAPTSTHMHSPARAYLVLRSAESKGSCE